jgi:hypothetical protein
VSGRDWALVVWSVACAVTANEPASAAHMEIAILLRMIVSSVWRRPQWGVSGAKKGDKQVQIPSSCGGLFEGK